MNSMGPRVLPLPGQNCLTKKRWRRLCQRANREDAAQNATMRPHVYIRFDGAEPIPTRTRR